MKIDELITKAQGELTAAQALPDTDDTKTSKVAAAQAKLSALQSAKDAAQEDINGAVRTRIPDAENSAKEAERKALAQSLGVAVDKLDEELERLRKLRADQQSEVDRERQAREAAETRVSTLETESQRAQRIAETSRKQLEDTLKRQAVERALLAQGVIHETGEGDDKRSYLDGAYKLTDTSSVTVDVEVDDEGNLQIKGQVQNAEEAAKKTKQEYPAMFADGQQGGLQTPLRTPGGGGTPGNSTGQSSGYNPRYNVPGQRQAS